MVKWLTGLPFNHKALSFVVIGLFGVLHCFQHCTGHIMTGIWVGRGNQYLHSVKVLYCKLPTIGQQLPTFPHEIQGLNRRPQSVLPLHHHYHCTTIIDSNLTHDIMWYSISDCPYVTLVVEKDVKPKLLLLPVIHL